MLGSNKSSHGNDDTPVSFLQPLFSAVLFQNELVGFVITAAQFLTACFCICLGDAFSNTVRNDTILMTWTKEVKEL